MSSSTPKSESYYPFTNLIRDVWDNIEGYRRRLAFWYFIRGISSFQGLLPPLILGAIADSLSSKTSTASHFTFLIIVFGINGLSSAYLRLTCKYHVGALANQIRLKIRQTSISKFINFDLDWHEQENSGKKVAVISRGADSARSLVRFVNDSGGGMEIFIGIFGVLGYLLFFDVKYFVLAFIYTLFYLGLNQKLNSTLYDKWHQLNKENEKVIGKNYDYFSNIGLIKRLGIGHQINRTLFEKELDFTTKTIATSRMSINKWISIQSISQTFQTLAIALLVYEIYTGRSSFGNFLVITGYFNRLHGSLGDIAASIDDVIDNKLGFLRLIQLTTSGRTDTNIGDKLSPSHPDISCKNIYFKYPKSRTNILNGLNFTVPFGQKVGLVGESGSGKSTFSKLLLRLYLIDKGQINFGDTNINQISTDSLRQQFSIVPQESDVFNLTFKENITIASDNLKFNKKLYEESLDIAECQPILTKIQNNHQTVLGEKGVKLSGGERQRLGIARAIYKNSPIMIFDESTSSLDSKTEERILNNIESKLSDKTIIWIAHRLSTLRFTDRIIVFKDGKVSEDGDFKKLIAQKGLFFQLWQIQQRSQLKNATQQ